MCGITGILNLDGDPVAQTVLHEMTAALVHRGPDAEGYFSDGALGLGHRRLAIIDLTAAGQQPMATDGRPLVLSYNGEVYNFRELRSELEAKGHSFRSRTDTEVVLRAFAEWGEEALERLQRHVRAVAVGPRATASCCWPATATASSRCTTRGGTGRFLFGSEVKAMLAHPAFRAELDPRGAARVLHLPELLHRPHAVRGRPAAAAGLRAASRRGRRRAGAAPLLGLSLPRARAWLASEEEYVEELDRLFRQAVEPPARSDVPVGSYLSGGMDSGSITAVAARRDRRTCSTLHRRLRPALGVGHRAGLRRARERRADVVPVRDRALRDGAQGRRHGARACRAWPGTSRSRASARAIPNFYAAQLASKFVKVVLSGAGGDELFGGYPWRYYRAVVNDDFEHYVDKYYAFWQRLLPDQRRRDAVLADRGLDVDDVWTARHLPRRVRHPRRRADPARGLHQPLALLRGEDLPARPAGGRGQALDGARPGDAACRSSTTTWSTSPCESRSG